MLIYGVFLVLSIDRLAPVLAEDRLEGSVKRLALQIDKLFTEQSRFDLVEKGLSKHLQGKLIIRQHDFEEETSSSSARLQKFIDSKIRALKALVTTSEKVTESYVYTQKWIHDAVVSKFRANPAPGEDPRKFDEDCRKYLRRISGKSVYSVEKDNDVSKTAVHVTVESFKCDNAVLRDFEWTGSDPLEKQFKANQQADPSIVRQYIGTNSGLTRMLPAIKWVAEPKEVTMDLFDPRFRPWYLNAEMPPKDIIFLIDYSGSVKGQTLHLLKVTIQFLLTTTTPNDYFLAIWYNNVYGYILEECCGQDFIPATTRNKRMLMTMLDKIEERDVANLPPALNETFNRFKRDFGRPEEKFRQALGDAGYSGGHKLVLLFTDGVENWPNEVIDEYKEEFPDETIRVFGFSMGYGTGEIPALDFTTCETGGSYAIVDSITDVRIQCRSYIHKLSEILSLSYREKPPEDRPITFTLPYMDVQRGGATISMSMPIVNVMENATDPFTGIAGIDISFSQLRDLLPANDNVYSFIIDNNGIALFHPKLRIPKRETYSVRRTACYNVNVTIHHRHQSRVPYGIIDERIQRLLGLVDSISSSDILEIEKNTPKFIEFRRSMIDRNCGSVIDDGSRVYRCYHLKDTPLIIGFVQNKRFSDFIMEPEQSTVPKLTYTPKDLIGYLITEKTLCPDELGAHGPLERFEPFVFGDYNSCPKTQEKYLPFGFVSSVQPWDRSWPDLEDNSTCLTTPLAYNLDPKYFISAFVQFYQGITVLYPKCSFEYVRQFATNPSRYPSLEPDATNRLYVEHEPISGSITMTRPIFDTNYGYRIASVGTQWSYRYLSDLWINVTKNDPGWKDCLDSNMQCLLISNEAFILGSTNGGAGRHMIELEAMLLESMMNASIVQKEIVRDYQADCPMEKRGFQIVSAGNMPRPLSLQSIFKKIVSYFYSIMAIDLVYFVEQVLSRPVLVNGNCKYETPENTEQCTLEFSKYNILNKNKEKLVVHLGKGKPCTGTVTIIPFPNVEISLLLFNGDCKPSKFNSAHSYWPVRVPDCNMTQQVYRRIRADLDYTREHIFETKKECIKINSSRQMNLDLTLIALLTVLKFSGIFS